MFKTVEEYINQYPREIQAILQKVRNTIKRAAPESIEKISYGIPTFYLQGNLIHFAANQKHLGIYPGPEAVEYFKDKLERFKTSKGTIKFSYGKPIPYDLIEDITKFRVKEQMNRMN
ncbi:iron chaperone [Oceanotoga teriensis]|uniref:iron chaperone n=1 Tax=Oceanotoga teriensis TaxID=515440 RepID=UPI002713CBFB|nr:DUF1801 domain-containing protein [Oceanotoga teriensis]MDO7976519.1 DUF1801 domain-containing protein [Oceanotoga teriensis]